MAEPTGAISVRNHKKFQHYKERNPPWIKLHASTLDDYDFGRLPDALKAQLMLIWLLASKHNNAIPLDVEWITRRLSLTEPLNLEALVDAGFIEIERRKDVVSKMLAPRKHPSSARQASKKSKRQRRVEEIEAAPTGPLPRAAEIAVPPPAPLEARPAGLHVEAHGTTEVPEIRLKLEGQALVARKAQARAFLLEGKRPTDGGRP